MFKKLIKRFRFTANERARLDLSGGLRLNPETQGIEVPELTVQNQPRPKLAIYSTDTSLTCATWIANPEAVKRWIGFGVDFVKPKLLAQDAPDPLYGIRFRISDGTTAHWYDGANWVAATLANEWNSQAEVSANISTFPATTRKIAVITNMWTNDARVTPKLLAIKVLYEADEIEEFDLLHKSLAVDMKELECRSHVALEMPADGDTVDFSDLAALGFESSYNIVGVAAAYNYSIDSVRQVDIADSFDPNTKILTLTDVVPESDVLWVEFLFLPAAAVQSDGDFLEIATVPRIDITRYQESNHNTNSTYIEDSVIDPTTGAGWKIIGPRISTVMVDLDLIAAKQYDLAAMKSAVMAHFSTSPFLRLRGIDEQFFCEVVTGPNFAATPQQNNLATARLTLRMPDVSFYSTPAVEAYAIKAIKFQNGNVSPFTIQ